MLTASVVVLAYVLLSTLLGLFTDPAPILRAALGLVGGTLFYLIPALLGVWRGKKIRHSRYVRFLLGFVAPGAQTDVLDTVYAEVQRRAPERVRGEVQVA